MRFRVWLFVLTLLLMTGLLANMTAAQTPAEISAETLATVKLRIGPGQEYIEITTLPYREPVNIEFRNFIGNWLLVRTNDGTRGWAASRFISWDIEIELATIPVSGELFGENPAPEATVAVVSSAPDAAIVVDGEPGRALSRLNVRAAADLTAPVIGKLEYRTLIVIEARNFIGNWLLVTAQDGTVRGWAASRYIGWDEEIELTTFPVSGEVLGDFDTVAATQTAGGTPAAPVEQVLTGGKLPDGTVPGKALVQNLNVRRGAGSTFESIGQIALNTPVIIEARNFIGDWLLIHTQDGSVRGWAASRFISWDDEAIELAFFPVSGEEIDG